MSSGGGARDPLLRRARRFARVGLLRELGNAGPAFLRTAATLGVSVR